MLTLVRPALQGQGTRAPSRRPLSPVLTESQQARVRALLRNLRAAYGSWSCLAEVTGIKAGSLSCTASHPRRASFSLVHRLAKAIGMPVDEILSTRLVSVDACPTCGARKGAS